VKGVHSQAVMLIEQWSAGHIDGATLTRGLVALEREKPPT